VNIRSVHVVLTIFPTAEIPYSCINK